MTTTGNDNDNLSSPSILLTSHNFSISTLGSMLCFTKLGSVSL